MADFQVSKGPKEDTGFFEKNGTLQQMTSVADSLKAMQSGSATSRFGGLANIVATILSLLG